MIPSGKTGYFEINFCSQRIGRIQQPILYKINNQHEFNFLVSAHVENAILELSVDHMDLIFEEGYLEEFLSRPVTIFNKSNSPVEYVWGYKEQGFQVVPKSGKIDKESSIQAVVTFKPVDNSRKLVEEQLTLVVTNGENRFLKVRGELKEVKCIL